VTAIVDPAQPPAGSHVPPGAWEARLVRVGDGDLGLAVSTSGGGLLVLSENAYPGWRARIDGAEAPIHRVDITLQGIVVPPGTHRVEFTMESRTLRAGLALSGAGVAVCVLLLLVGRRREQGGPAGADDPIAVPGVGPAMPAPGFMGRAK